MKSIEAEEWAAESLWNQVVPFNNVSRNGSSGIWRQRHGVKLSREKGIQRDRILRPKYPSILRLEEGQLEGLTCMYLAGTVFGMV